ncbi:MAG: bifunctional (p)ppGpp synthetase/guanosine-3',5'-bis(diphosphate) 3'-pyrophosphohydrolase [Acidobacteria bacterium]|nr:bifunctional (p)ppGpp synthetase/guanosine-3',5'-bis(diphosphate) 3'-pyrophosphohydrolase [Acidobacteriota bacterium]
MPPEPAIADPSTSDNPSVVLERFRDLEGKVRQTRPKEDLGLLRRAFDFAAERHRLQKRKSGEPFMVHPLEVAHTLADMRMDVVSLATGLLHDVVEDTTATVAEVEKEFGKEVAHCVDGVTKLSKLDFYSPEARQAESFRKMLLAMVTDIRVIVVKLADRLHNIRTLEHLPPEKRERISRETLEIYAPIALRLGMGKIRGELEDLAFAYLDPPAFADLSLQLESKRHANEEFLEEIKKEVAAKLREAEVPAQVEGRIKRRYSIYQKLKRQHCTVDEVYDLLALRIITDSVKNCYAALGVIHNHWRPVPGRIKDFIAMPRPNLYQSLHTSVISHSGQPFEVQIRTEEMHRLAEEGIAAHWKYKEGHKGPMMDEQRMAWLRQLVEWQRDIQDPSDFLSTLKIDLYPEEAYTFTPQGKVIILPRDASPIDFAYAIHTEVGHTCVGAKVNGRIVPLKSKLRNGDIVEILTQAGHTPSRDWLSVVKTSRARNKIKHWININQREKALEIGSKLLEKEARRAGLSLSKVPPETMERVAHDYGCGKMEDLMAALGYGKYSARQVVGKLAPAAGEVVELPKGPSRPHPVSGDEVLSVKGVDDLLVYRAGCCNPIKGEPIVGYVTRGKGVAVHSKTCPNVENLMYEAERRIEVEWAKSEEATYPVRLTLHTDDRPGLLNDVTSILSNDNTNITSVEASTDTARSAMIEMTLEVQNMKQLERIVGAMRRIPGVRDVERVHKL